ncbi:hypothetical protein LINPERHAP2_LOCUS2619 [Linum perenne]
MDGAFGQKKTRRWGELRGEEEEEGRRLKQKKTEAIGEERGVLCSVPFFLPFNLFK